MRFIMFAVLGLTLISFIFLAAFSLGTTGDFTKPTPNQSLMPEKKVIEENVIDIKKQKIEPVLEGKERKIDNVVEITAEEKIVRKYPGVIQIVEENGSTVISRGRIKIVQ